MNLALLTTAALWILLGVFAGAIAARRGRGRGRWTIFGLLFGPAAFLISLMTPRPTAKCPYCAEFIREEAIVCRFCGQSLAVEAPGETRDAETSEQGEYGAEEVDALFLQWLTEQRVEVDQLPDSDIAKYRATFEEALREAVQAQSAS